MIESQLMKNFMTVLLMIAGLGFIAFSDYDIKIVKAQAAACDEPSCG